METIDLTQRSGAIFSACGRYRHVLWRMWDPERLYLPLFEGPSRGHPIDLYIGLNPSKAGIERDDPTVRKWRGFSQRRGRRGFIAVNLYDLVATEQSDLWSVAPQHRCSSTTSEAYDG